MKHSLPVYGIHYYNLFVALILLSCIIFFSCGKDGVSGADVSAQWQTDLNGGIIKSLNDGQWQQKNFTKTELNLFSSMDTVSLAGTSAPASVKTQHSYVFPNPFRSSHAFPVFPDTAYKGSMVFKYVIVDKNMNPLLKTSARISLLNGSRVISVAPDLPGGKYRVYYTLSASGKPHFFQTWGNVQRE